MKLLLKGKTVRSGERVIRLRGTPLTSPEVEEFQCFTCRATFKGYFDEPARFDQSWVPCTRCPDILVFHVYDNFTFPMDDHMAGSKEATARIVEQNLRPCLSCGSKYCFRTTTSRCPLCYSPLADHFYAPLQKKQETLRVRPADVPTQARDLLSGLRPFALDDMRESYKLVTEQTQMYEANEMIVDVPARPFLALLASTMVDAEKHTRMRYYAACYLSYAAHAGIDELDYGLDEVRMEQTVQEVTEWWRVNQHSFPEEAQV